MNKKYLACITMVLFALMFLLTDLAVFAATGKEIYRKRCQQCHGKNGAGDGPTADTLDPRPRDFTKGLFKFRTTGPEDVPSDNDLEDIISNGVPTTAMPAFADVLKKEERQAVITYIKTFSDKFKQAPTPIKAADPVASSADSINNGKELFDENCSRCHGDNGKGNGEIAMKKLQSGRFNDKWGNPILPRNLTKAWTYKAGSTPKDIYMRITAGISGTPMPSFEEDLEKKERWDIANYVNSIAKNIKDGQIVIKSKYTNNEIALDTTNAEWEDTEYTDVKMTGQISVFPRLNNPTIDLVKVRSIYNEKEIAFLLEWDDRSKNITHNEETAPSFGKTTFPILYPPKKNRPSLRDAIQMQFPVKIPEGLEKPFFILGNAGKPVQLLKWQANTDNAEELNASGYKNKPVPQSKKSQQTQGKGKFNDGTWKVVIKRSLIGDDAAKDITFEKGKLIPIAIHAWNGNNNERGLRSSISSWHYVALEEAVGTSLYVKALIAMIIAVEIELYAVKWAGKR